MAKFRKVILLTEYAYFNTVIISFSIFHFECYYTNNWIKNTPVNMQDEIPVAVVIYDSSLWQLNNISGYCENLSINI